MARKKAARPRKRKPQQESSLEPVQDTTGVSGEFGAQTTGRSIVTFLDDSPAAVKSALSSMKSRAGVSKVCRMADFGVKAFAFEEAQQADAIVMDELGMAVVAGDTDRMSAMTSIAEAGDANVLVEPEYMNYTFDGAFLGLNDDMLDDEDASEPVLGSGTVASEDFLRGYQQAVNTLVNSLLGGSEFGGAAAPEAEALAAFRDSSSSTWGLKATRVLQSRFSGRGIRVAVLDTGLDLQHPDFAARTLNSQSFISGEAVQDGNGHGTHCIGTSCGSRRPGIGPRYGIAFEAQIFAGKVLSNAGSGSDGAILSGINWAIRNRCQVVSMSLGRAVRVGERPMQSYETAGRRALNAGTLIIAAAGNDSSRPFMTRPVSSPANASTIVAVAAVDSRLQVATFSNGGINSSGGEINLAGPGVNVHSSWPMPRRLRSINGTSMATPHVAGIAALVAQEVPSARGVGLYRELRRRARRLPLPRRDVGNGLVEAT